MTINFTQSKLDAMVRDADTASKHVLGDSTLVDVCVHVKALAAEVEQLTRERDEAVIDDARHMALLLQQRAKTRRLAEIADSLWRQRDERDKACRWLLGVSETWQDVQAAFVRWPWLRELI